MRASIASGDSSASGWARRTRATSRFTRGSGASRMPTWARPSTSMARTRAASPRPSARAPMASRSLPHHRHQVGRHQGEEALSQEVDQVAGQLLWAEPAGGEVGHGHQRPAGVALGQRLDDLVQLREVVLHRVRRRHLVEDGKRVTGRAPPPPDGHVERLVGDLQVGRLPHLLEQLAQGVGAEQPELEVLGAAADGGQHLLGVGGGQDEDHVGGRLLQRLQQGVGRRRREHVDLVDDVDLLPSGRAQGRPGDQVAHGVDPVVGGGVELVDVERGAPGDLHARRADAAGLAVVGVGAVEGLGQDAGGRRLAGASGPAEQVGVGDLALADGVAEGQDDVVLALDLGERRRPEPPVERLVGRVVGGLRPASRSRASATTGSLPATGRHRAPAFGATARLTAAHGLTR